MQDYNDFFSKATGFTPFPWQIQASQKAPECITIPTGMGKTAGLILPWLWRIFRSEADTPSRLVYCLPMRVLVEQTEETVKQWLENLGMDVSCHVLLGGRRNREWDNDCNQPVILIGTQDMLLSRALNRGYAESRFRWPVQFGLLNNDCLWIMDEVQLMGPGLSTSLQLHAFRNNFGTYGPSECVWMSATLSQDWLNTVDHQAINLRTLEPSSEDLSHPGFSRRYGAVKNLHELQQEENLAERVIKEHIPGSLTLVIRNTVSSAVDTFKELSSKTPEPEVLLLHSRFRKKDRDRTTEALFSPLPEEGRILVATQVIEAGVDISARTMFTDVAPWASMVQRFGRCNRRGEYDDAGIFWIPPGEKAGFGLPYSDMEVGKAVSLLKDHKSVSPADLRKPNNPERPLTVLRRKDIIDLFDTSPDLAGSDIDVSRFIRDTDGRTAFLYWRNIKDKPAENEDMPLPEEICRAPVDEVKKLLKKKPGWKYDHITGEWQKISSCRAGMTVMLNSHSGGYSPITGFSPSDKNPVQPIDALERVSEDSIADDPLSCQPEETISKHTLIIIEEIQTMCGRLDEIEKKALLTAARWHDAGKSHSAFQERFGNSFGSDQAKGKWVIPRHNFPRPGFRHELASALALLENGGGNLEVYLTAAHHGKIRLSIRSLPSEKPPANGVPFARGVHEGDILPETQLGNGEVMPETELKLDVMALGGNGNRPSWLSRTISLRDEYGPFKLAYLEALLRVADWRGSRRGESHE